MSSICSFVSGHNPQCISAQHTAYQHTCLETIQHSTKKAVWNGFCYIFVAFLLHAFMYCLCVVSSRRRDEDARMRCACHHASLFLLDPISADDLRRLYSVYVIGREVVGPLDPAGGDYTVFFNTKYSSYRIFSIQIFHNCVLLCSSYSLVYCTKA